MEAKQTTAEKGAAGQLVLTETDRYEKMEEKDFTKIIDYDKIDKDIQLRYKKPGDFFIFSKDGKSKSLSRYFIDQKIPRGRAGPDTACGRRKPDHMDHRLPPERVL